MNTIPDVVLANAVYQDIYTETGIAVGTAILLQNKGTSGCRIQIKPSAPASSSIDGVQLSAFEFYVVDSGESGCWAKGSGRLSVQEIGE